MAARDGASIGTGIAELSFSAFGTGLLMIAIIATVPGVSHAKKCTPHVPKAGDVLVTGGEDLNENEASNTEFFDPGSGSWLTGCPSKTQHDEAQIVTVGSRLMIIGGESLKAHTKKVEFYKPSNGGFVNAPGLKKSREDFAAVKLSDGSILAIGGFDAHENPQNTAEIFVTHWKVLKQTLTVPRGAHCAAVMAGGSRSGQVLIAGGTSADEDPPQLKSAERYDPASGAFTATAGEMIAARAYAVCTALNDGTVLVTGGIDDNLNARDTAEIYNPDTDTFSQTAGNMNSPRVDHSATLLPDGTVLVAGGETSYTGVTTKLNTAEIYDPATGKFTPTSTMNDHRDDNTATVISGSGTPLDGQVLIEGGFFNDHAETTAEIYDPVNKTFTPTSAMNFAHGEASAALIP